MQKLLKEWLRLTYGQRQEFLTTRDLPIAFLHKVWDEMPGRQMWCCLEGQKLHVPFIREHWNSMQRREQIVCCRKQKLTVSFVIEHWDSMDNDAKIACLLQQPFTDGVLVKLFGGLSKDGKKQVIEEGFLHHLSVASMPSFVTDGNKFVRQYAQKRIDDALSTVAEVATSE